MRKNKATHRGTCQCCGAVQMLPGNVLAKHGYNVTWGFFSGVCQGAGHAAFEVSCDLVASFIARAEKQLAETLAWQAELRKPVTDGKAWVHHYERGYGRNPSGYRWVQVEIVATEHKYQSGGEERSYCNFHFVLDGVTHKLDGYGVYQLPALLATLSEKKAASLDKEIAQLRRYIAWQAQRVAEWKPAELKPVG